MKTRFFGTWVTIVLTFSCLITSTIASNDLTQMNVSPRIVQVGVETEIIVSYTEKTHKEGDVLVEGKIIQGYAPTLQGSGVSIMAVEQVAQGWRIVIKPTQIGCIDVFGEDETGATHVDSIQVVQELPPPLESNSHNTEDTLNYVVIFLVTTVFLAMFAAIIRSRSRRNKPSRTMTLLA